MVAWFCALLAAYAPLTALQAQEAAGRLVLTVVDAVTKRPVVLARVVVLGPDGGLGYTDADGRATFEPLSPGTYRASARKQGYLPSAPITFNISNAQQIAVDVALAAVSGRQVIGSVRARTLSPLAVSGVDGQGPRAKLADRLVDALGSVPGVMLGQDGRSISIDGMDSSQTGVTVDGVPAGGFGTGGDMRLVNSDLFASATVATAPSNGNAAGTVNFRSQDPTIDFQSNLSASYGSADKSSLAFSARGTAGTVGFVANHAVRGTNGPLDGSVFADRSGIGPYVHRQGTYTEGTLFKVRAPLGTGTSLSATSIATNSASDDVCTTFSGPLACGYGPGNVLTTRAVSTSATLDAMLGDASFSVLPYVQAQRLDDDLVRRYVGGVSVPSRSLIDLNVTGYTASAALPFDAGQTFSLHASQYRTVIVQRGQDGLMTAPIALTSSYAYSDFSLADNLRSNDRLTFALSTGIARSAPAIGFRQYGSFGATWRPHPADSLSASYVSGYVDAGFASEVQLTDPSALTLNCAAGAAFGSGPGQGGGPEDTSKARVGWLHRGGTALLSLAAYRTVQHGVLAQTFVNGAFLPRNYFPPGYFTAASSLYGDPDGCGVRRTIGPANIFVRQFVRVPTRTYQGVVAAGVVGWGPVTFFPSFVISSVSAGGALSAGSTLVSGGQFLRVPLHTASLVIDMHVPRSPLEGIASVTYIGSNNGYDLPAFTTISAGFSRTVRAGTFTVAVNNVGNVHAPAFAGREAAVPLATSGGPVVPVLAQPLPPRAVNLSFTTHVGRPERDARVPAEQAAAGPSAEVQRFDLVRLPTSPPAQPFGLDTASPNCTPEAHRTLEPFMRAANELVVRVEAAGAGGRYPASLAAPLAAIPGAGVSYRGGDVQYVLLFTLTKPVLQAFARCATFAIASTDDVKAGRVYARPDVAAADADVQYAPRFGFYLVAHRSNGGGLGVRHALPDRPPAAPLALEPGCPKTVEPVARVLAQDLSRYVAGFDPDRAAVQRSDGFTLSPHTARSGWWVDIRFDDPATFAAIDGCLQVASASGAEIARRGLEFAPAPALNFAPQVGLYAVQR